MCNHPPWHMQRTNRESSESLITSERKAKDSAFHHGLTSKSPWGPLASSAISFHVCSLMFFHWAHMDYHLAPSVLGGFMQSFHLLLGRLQWSHTELPAATETCSEQLETRLRPLRNHVSLTGSEISLSQLFLSLKNKTNKERDHLSHIRELLNRSLFFNLFFFKETDCAWLRRISQELKSLY